MIKQLKWAHLNEDGKLEDSSQNQYKIMPQINVEDVVNTPSKIKAFFDNNFTCQVSGVLDVTKVTG